MHLVGRNVNLLEKKNETENHCSDYRNVNTEHKHRTFFYAFLQDKT